MNASRSPESSQGSSCRLLFNASYAPVVGSHQESVRFRQVGYDVQMEPDKSVQRFVQNSFLIAMRAEALRSIFDVSHRPNAITLHATAAYLRHIGSARQHGGQGHGIVNPLVRRFE